MKSWSFHILRVGTAITFLWIGILIFKDPEGWGSMVVPWVLSFLPFGLREAMVATAVLDVAVGVLLLVDTWVWAASFVGVLHIAGVLFVTGINTVTVRDIGLLAAAIALFVESLPRESAKKVFFWRRREDSNP